MFTFGDALSGASFVNMSKIPKYKCARASSGTNGIGAL